RHRHAARRRREARRPDQSGSWTLPARSIAGHFTRAAVSWVGRPDSRSIRLEDIAGAAHGLEGAREFWIALALAPEPRHLDIDGARVAAEARLFRQHLARHRLADTAG